MTRTLDAELLNEALDKAANYDAHGWANQVGLDIDAFLETMAMFTVAQMQANPILMLLMDEDKVEWMIAAFSAAFQAGWIARALQKEELV